ncbi:ATP synthase B/B' CF family protein [Candidatus Endolissoclinum faulkneri L2]|uniref:ATP synthase B/B' CF family protein n=1 Tax=Candidatus Endolissoclinum faulkneri L2 TaxID=1193729 RepID=K7YFX3_9PROT|nr:ATP synthase B/B' CF family protein [Candidatus Endolissoclinum faulkneri]AFX98485.1 ATP synthase B/B' CF family protein [Candidatus Endolissoclinum faulkneri L2]
MILSKAIYCFRNLYLILLSAITYKLPAWANSDKQYNSSGLPQFDTDTYSSQIFWLIVSFLLFYFIMSTKVIPRIGFILRERQKRIENDINIANRLREEADEMKIRYETFLGESRSQANEIICNSINQIDNQRAYAKKTLKSSERIKSAAAIIIEQRTKALKSLDSVACEAAADATKKLIGVSISKGKVAKAVMAVTRENTQNVT